MKNKKATIFWLVSIFTIILTGIFQNCGELGVMDYSTSRVDQNLPEDLRSEPIAGAPVDASSIPLAATPGSKLGVLPASGVCAFRPGENTCTITLKWSVPEAPAACVFYREKGLVVTCGSARTLAIPWISGKPATFDLRTNSSVNSPLLGTVEARGVPIKIGATRFDAWSAPADVLEIQNLKQVGYRFFERLPFYTTLDANGDWNINSDGQAIADREIDIAVSRGIHFWAFGYSRMLTRDYATGRLPASADEIDSRHMRFNYRMSNALDAYLKSSRTNKPAFSLILYSDLIYFYLNIWRPASVSRDQAWQNLLDDIRPYFARQEYHRTPDGRPILFLLGTDWLKAWDGDANLAAQKLRDLRELSPKGAGPLFISVMYGNPRVLTPFVKAHGFDSASTYALGAGINTSRNVGTPVPFDKQSETVAWFINSVSGRLANPAVDIVPPVSAGWDFRPLIGYGTSTIRPANGNWFEPATIQEFIAQLDQSVNFAVTYPDNVWSKSVLIYAWNELAEGGYIMPTLQEGSRILDAIGQYQGINLASTGVPSVAARPRPFIANFGSGCPDGYGIWLMGSQLVPNSIVQLRAPRTGNVQVADRVLATIANPTYAKNGTSDTLSFCLVGAAERNAFAATGLDVVAINKTLATASNIVHVKKKP